MDSYSLHSLKQDQAFFSEKPIILCATGIQWGKSTVGALKLRLLVSIFNSPSDNFIVMAPTYKILQQSTKRVFDQVFKGLGKYNKVEACFTIHNGPTIYFRTSTDPDSIVGMTNVRGIWCDEAGLYSLYSWENIQGRAAFRNCQIILTTSPYSMNWILKDIILPTKRGLRTDCEVIQATSLENPYFPREVYEKRKLTMDARRFKMMFGGEFDRPEGLVYDCFNEEYVIDTIPDFTNNYSISFYGGIDWGHRDPFVLVTRAVSSFGDQYDVSEFYKTGLRPSQILEAVGQKDRIYDYKRIWADPSRPDMIAELQSAGFPVIPAENDIQKGIDTHYELIRSGSYKISKDCKYTIDEYETYHYPDEGEVKVDKSRNKTKIETPVDQSNHCMDVARYLSMGLRNSRVKHTPKLAIN